MKSRSLLVFILIFSLAVVPSLQLALAASSSSSTKTSTTTTTTSTSSAPKSPYSERLDIYTAGYNDYWQVTLSPVNASRPAIVAAESVSGVSAYELTALKTSSATPSSQLFWADGYKVVKLPFMPSSGAFLNITASSQSAAQSAASSFDSLLGANFVEIGSSGSNYTFFSPAGFATAGPIIFDSVPAAKGGLANMTSAANFQGYTTPTEILTGVRSGSSFTHAVAFGSTETRMITNNSMVLTSALGTNKTFTSSPAATSTQLVVHSMDGLIVSKDAATVTNNQASFSGTYSINVPSNSRILPNVTILQDPPTLSATRVLDKGSAVSGGLVSVTLTLKNTAVFGTIQNIVVNDSWWKAYPSVLAVSAGNSSVNVPSLTASQNYTQVYVLKVTSSESNDFTIPSTMVSYSYSLRGLTLNLQAETNQDELRTNNPGPALIVRTSSEFQTGAPLGSVAHYIVTVSNVGDGPALNLQSGTFTNPTLTQGGGVWKFNTTVPLTSIVGRNFSQTFTVGWTTPDGSKGTLLSNPFTLLLSHTGLVLPLMQFTLTSTLSPAVLKLGTVNANYTLTNAGGAAATNITVSQPLVTGLGCKSILNGTAQCTSTGLTVAASSVLPGASVFGRVALTFSNDIYVNHPGFITAFDSGAMLRTAGNSLVVPAGVVVTKAFAANALFVGQNDTVTVTVANQGTLPVYNMTVTAQPDGFDRAVAGSLHATYVTLAPNSVQSFQYTVEAIGAGNHTTTATSVSYSVAGSAPAYSFPSSNLLVYKTVVATTSTVPSSPVEGSAFSLAVSVQNPSGVDVTNVSVSIPIPQGLTIVNASSGLEVKGHALTLSLSSLAAGATSSHSATLKAASDGSISLGSGTLTFQFQGATLSGVVFTSPMTVGIDLLIRYELPIGLAVLLTIAIAVYMHRKLTVPPSQVTTK